MLPSRNKQRLYIALYARGGRPDTYHWALHVGPKTLPDVDENAKTGIQFHAKEKLIGPQDSQWYFEELDIPFHATNMLLVRIAIAKIEDLDRLCHILRAVPIRQGTAGWNCIAWVQEGLALLDEDEKALGTRVIEWANVRNTAITYCNTKKAQHRFDGKGEGDFDIRKPPTFDLITNQEIIP
ncbi:hypothetical protein JVU11DRAFT_4694 [Chiua virens]|nr:hypothetical protein JVU11DRAFT_4694 [Chiua virens]